MKKFAPLFSWLKEAIRNIIRLLGNFFLIILAMVLFVPLVFIATVWKIYASIFHENRKARDIMSGTGEFFEAIAICKDQLGGVAFGGMFNALLLKDAKLFPFGNPYETISEVLGCNQMLGNLTPLGHWVVKVVNWADFTQEDHCREAALKAFQISEYKVNLYRNIDKYGSLKQSA